ncbi:uncharacterized protein [Clytia hemisphaerica]|uniref:uncharacterized protein n=1 Tax=Clytia hemisphaerica TaxID=252671 RepID=UPI0034D774F2
MEFWEERALSKRSQASVLAQIKSIEKGGLLSEYEKGEIERLVRSEGEPAGQDNSVNNVYNETTQDDDLAVDDVDIDFTVFSKSSQCHSVESFVGKESDIGDDFWDHEDDFEPEVQVERLNVFEKGDVVRITNEEENKIIFRIHQILNSNECREIPSLKNIDKCLVMKEVSIVNSLLRNFVAIGIPDITKANRLLYAGSYIVCERLGLLKEKGEKLKSKKPWWQRRLEGSIQQWRKDLGRVNEIKNGKTLKRKTLDELERRYQITERGTRAVTVFLETKVKAASNKIKFFVERNLTNRHNTLYKNNQSYLYKELSGSKKFDKAPKEDEAREFWSNIWSMEGDFNEKAGWLEDVSEKFDRVEGQGDVVITSSDVKKGISRMANWKAPGPDGVRGFWFKKLTALHPFLCESLDFCLVDGNVPDWMVKGRTVLILGC